MFRYALVSGQPLALRQIVVTTGGRKMIIDSEKSACSALALQDCAVKPVNVIFSGAKGFNIF